MRLKLIKKGNFARQWVSGTTKNYFYARLYGCDRPSTQQTYRSIKSGDTKLHINNRSLWQQIGGGRKIFLKLKCLRAGLFQNWWMDLNALLGRILWVRLGEMEAIKSTKGQKWKINMQLRGKFSSFINLAMWVFSEAGSIVCVVNISYPRLERSHIGCGRFTLLAMCSIRDWLRVCHTSDILPFEQVKSFLSHVDHTFKHTCKSAQCFVKSNSWLDQQEDRGYFQRATWLDYITLLRLLHNQSLCPVIVFFFLSWTGRSFLALSLKVSQTTTTTMINGQWNYARINYTLGWCALSWEMCLKLLMLKILFEWKIVVTFTFCVIFR